MDISDRIKTLERELNISMTEPWKIVGGFVVIAGLLIFGCMWWCKPSLIKDESGDVCTKKTIQFTIAVIVGLASIAWLLWGWYQG